MELTELHPDALKIFEAAIPMTAYNNELLEFSVTLFTPVVYINRTTWTVLNDSTRQAAIASGLESIPCVLVDIEPDKEVAAAIAYSGGINANLSGKPSGREASKTLAHEARKLYRSGQGREQLLAMGADVDYWHDFIAYIEGDIEEEEEAPETTIATSTVHNSFDIPELNVNCQPHREELEGLQWTAYSSKARDYQTDAILFYVDDRRFNNIIVKPSGARYAIEPNYSTNQIMPRVMFLSDLWKKRQHAVEFQQDGIKPIVDMNVSRLWFDDNLIGVPRDWKVYANRYSAKDKRHLYEAYSRAVAHAGDDIIYCVYGTIGIKDECQQNGWVFIDSDKATGRK